MAADMCTSEDRSFFKETVLPLIRLKAHAKLRNNVRYVEASYVGFDEIMVNVRKGEAKGWQGLSPRGLRESNADSPDNILSEMTRIQSGKMPLCTYEYLLSTGEQMRIKHGMRGESTSIIRKSEDTFKSEMPIGATGMMNAEFERTSTEMADRKKLADKGKSTFAGLVGLDGKPLTSSDN